MEILDIPLLPSHYYYKLRTIASTLSIYFIAKFLLFIVFNRNFTLLSFICVFLQLDRQMLSLAYRFLRAKTPEQRAAVDLETHYTKVSRYIYLYFKFFCLLDVKFNKEDKV